MEKIAIGEIVKPQGIKGELKLKSFINSLDAINGINKLYINGNHYTINSVSLRQNFIYLQTNEINDRNLVEPLRNKLVYAVKEEVEQNLQNDEYFLEDLINCKLISEKGKDWGTVVDIQNFGSKDVYYVNKNGKELLFPNADGVIVKVVVAEKTIIINEKRLKEVLVI